MNQQYSFYKMSNNQYLGNCLTLVYEAGELEQNNNGLTSKNVVILIKTNGDNHDVKCIDDLFSSSLFDKNQAVALRVASECSFGIFGDSHCDCENQRVASLEYINQFGQGVYVSLPQEAQGRGLHYKAAELQIQVNGLTQEGKFIGKLDIYKAAKILLNDEAVDIRGWDIAKKIFSESNLNKYNYFLLSSNPSKIDSLSKNCGLKISGYVDVDRKISKDNVGEYLAKVYQKDFLLTDGELQDIYRVLLRTDTIPERATSLLQRIKEDFQNGREFNINNDLLRKVINIFDAKNRSPITKILDSSLNQPYREKQLELLMTDEKIDKLFKADLLDGITDLSFEENYYYDSIYVEDLSINGLKIRRKSKVGGARKLIESRLIYTTYINDDEYMIKNIKIDNPDILHLLLGMIDGYQINYVPVFTHICESSLYSDLLILIKRYSAKLITMAIMGRHTSVEAFLKASTEVIEPTVIPSPTESRNVNNDLGRDFDYMSLAEEEIKRFRQYYQG